MFETALQARLPVIGVTSDDPVHQLAVLEKIAGQPVLSGVTVNIKPVSGRIYWTADPELATADLYRKFEAAEATLVVFNPTAASVVLDAGLLIPPAEMLMAELEPYEQKPDLALALKGLSIKSVREVLALTAAREHQVTPTGVRRTRSSVILGIQGLTPVDTSYDFYDWPDDLRVWMDLNGPYFLKDGHAKLQPRGLLFDGQPGVGKTMAPKAIANKLGVPLYRLDIASMLDKFIGTSETRVANSLKLIERESPCVLMLDEIEKVLDADEDTLQRILSQLLWWLAEHRSKVLTIMTTNKKDKLPPELYRPGRIDRVFHLEALPLYKAKWFASSVYKGILGKPPMVDRQQKINAQLQELATQFVSHITPAQVTTIVTNLIKQHHWDEC